MKQTLLSLALLSMTSLPAYAVEPAWPDLSASLYEGRTLLDGAASIRIENPYRTTDDARTRIAAEVEAPANALLQSVTLILDENPMPVSAIFTFSEPLPRFAFDVTMRINGPTPLHVVSETTDGTLYVSESFVKTSGQGACSAPPGTDPELALATLGKMTIAFNSAAEKSDVLGQLQALAHKEKQIKVDISHPSHSGMQMDQISLLFIPMRYVEHLDVDLDGKGYVDMTGSISLSENPSLSLSVPSRVQSVDVTMTDTDGAVTRAHQDVPGF